MRTAFIDQLLLEARSNNSIFLLTGDLGYSVLETFANEYPDRFLNVGIAEQNMTGIAAGLSHMGFKVFTYSIGNFSTLRCLEQIRNDVAYHNLDVTIVSVGAGYAYGPLGASHHATEDIGILRSLPNMKVYSPGDPLETKSVVHAICKDAGPTYLRLGKSGEPKIHTLSDQGISPDYNILKTGAGTVYLTTGSILNMVYPELTDTEFGLISISKISPLNQKLLAELAHQYDTIVTVEEHQLAGGFGSAILECYNDLRQSNLIDRFPTIRRVGIDNYFEYLSGSQHYLRGKAGLNVT